MAVMKIYQRHQTLSESDRFLCVYILEYCEDTTQQYSVCNKGLVITFKHYVVNLTMLNN